MVYPPRVIEFLQSDFLSTTQPFCFLVDAEYRLLDYWGEGQWCHLDAIDIGADMLRCAPFLLGCLADDARKFEFIAVAEDVVLHLHTIPEADKHYVVLLDAMLEHDLLQQRQQSVNELRLMHARQRTLIARQRDLISELVEAKSELDHHRREVERASANKSRFIAMMSHEFRTPLASISNYADLARDAAASSDDIDKSIEAISRSTKHLTSLVEALLDDARLDAGEVELQVLEFDLHALLDDLAAMMAPMAAEKGLSFATQIDEDVPATVRADEVRFRQILINLLGNAVKFTNDGGVRLLVTYADGRLVTTVRDTGPGISIEDQERVFQAFERGSRQSATGAGLGLTITLRLAQLMGGEIALDSTPGEGCTVTVHVPVEEVSGGHEARTAVLPAPGMDTVASKPLSILICDDDEDMIALIEHYLHRSGYGLIATSDSSEAIAKTLKYDPDLVLMDCNVPGVSGVDAASVLRRQGYGKPIVALTASKLSDSDKKAFTQYFRKPAVMHELLTAIKRLTH